MKHTKLFSILLASALALSLTACAGTPATSSSELPDSSASQPESSASQSESSVAESSASAEEQSSSGGEIIVFAAASMTDTLTEIKETYEAANPGVTITYNFDSSGTLKTQIEEGAACDLFISAGQTQMDQLDI